MVPYHRRETESCSDYELARDGHVVRLRFVEKAEAQCLPVAAASMVSKYCEAMMSRFNAYWKQHLPELAPTAGYYSDGRLPERYRSEWPGAWDR